MSRLTNQRRPQAPSSPSELVRTATAPPRAITPIHPRRPKKARRVHRFPGVTNRLWLVEPRRKVLYG